MVEATGALSLAGTDLQKEFLNITGQVNSTLLLSGGNVSWTDWVEKESGIIRRAENRERFKITPEMLGLSDSEGKGFFIDANIVLTKFYGGFNDPWRSCCRRRQETLPLFNLMSTVWVLGRAISLI